MQHRSITLSDLTIDFQEIYRSMGYQKEQCGQEIQKMVNEVFAEINEICVPQYMYEIYPGKVLSNVSIMIENEEFRTGRIITSYLSGTENFCVYVTTAGQAYDSYKQTAHKEGDLLKEFIADSIGSVIAEACVAKIEDELSKIPGKEHTYPYSPGYCGWKLTEQHKLFSLLPSSPCGITLTDSCLMLPIKSTSGIIALGGKIERKAYACKICNYKSCYKRKQS